MSELKPCENACHEHLELLKSCPFCGGSARVIDYLGNAYRQHRVRCCDDECNIGTRHFDEKQQAITAWNIRQEVEGEGRG